MSSRCHPAILWLVNYIVSITLCIICIVLLLTTFSSRPTATTTAGVSQGLNIAETCTVAHLAFSILYCVLLQASLRLLTDGTYLDYKYRIEKDFKILSAMAFTSSLALAILGILIFVYKDSALLAPGVTPDEQAAIDAQPLLWYQVTTAASDSQVLTLKARQFNVTVFIYYLFISDILCFLLGAVGLVIIVGSSRRQKYNIERAMESERLTKSRSTHTLQSRRSSRSTSHHLVLS